MRMILRNGAALLALIAGLAGPGSARDTAPVRYIDAHVHLTAIMPPAEEFAQLRAAGVARGLVMHPEPGELAAAAAGTPDFAVPFISIARTPAQRGLRLDATTAATLAAMHGRGEVCGFGEIPTRIEPRTLPNDAAALLAPDREAIYAAANRSRVPVNMHVSLASAETEAAIVSIARRFPRMPIILAHAGWETGAEVMTRLMSAHRNIHADLSIRLDNPRSAAPNEVALSIVMPDGALKPEWRTVITRFPDRFLFGLDISGDRRPLRIAALVADAKVTLGGLPQPVEEAVAHGNVERLIGTCGRRGARARR
jgi:predicted TIM-barrel fold metal-dependent hydrolase